MSKIEPYTPLVYPPADVKNYVPNKKFNSSDFPDDYGPMMLTTKIF